VIDAVTLTSKVKFAEQQMISVDAEMADVELTLDALPDLEGVKMFYILLEYFQDINGKLYPLKSGAYNALRLVRVV
jgi:hypothetical protein